MTFTERLIARQEPWLTEDYEILLKALAKMFEPLLEVAEEEGEDGTEGYIPAYGRLLSPALCPAKDLGYLGQFVGVEVPTGASEAEARALVKAEAGLERGTLKALETAITRTLTKTESAFPSLTATDSFTRADENPLSNGGKWSLLPWVGAKEMGRVSSNAWTVGTGFPGAYWNASEQTNPAVSLEFEEVSATQETRLFSCLNGASLTEGYVVEYRASTEELKLGRVFSKTGAFPLGVASGFSLAAGDSLGLGVRGGKITGWRKRSGVWSKIVEGSDSKYSKGNAGAHYTQGRYKNFALGEMPAATEGFRIVERSPTPYSFEVFVAPGGATQALYNAINEVIPAGLWYTISEVEDPWSLGAKKWSAIAAGKKWSELKAGDY